MCRLIGGTGRSFSCRSLRTLTRFMRFLTSFLTSSSPTRSSNCSISSSKSGFFSSTAAASFCVPPPEVCTCGLCFSWKLGSPLVTKSRGLRPSRLLRTPVVSQMAVSRSPHSVMKAASS